MRSEFEESEFRGPLYNQLGKATNFVWEPGQVFEEFIGIDYAIHHDIDFIWTLHGYNPSLAGVFLNRRNFDYIWRKRNRNKRLPNFSLNFFLQAKRADYFPKSKKELIGEGIKGRYWKFKVDTEQQIALEELDRTLGSDALVVYASPTFHTSRDLFRHTAAGTIIENTTFPHVSALAGHTAWCYDTPGVDGVLNSKFKKYKSKEIFETIQSMIESRSTPNSENRSLFDESTSANLHNLSTKIGEILKSKQTPRAASCMNSYNDYLLAYDLYRSSDNPIEESIKDYMLISFFCRSYNLNWFTLG